MTPHSVLSFSAQATYNRDDHGLTLSCVPAAFFAIARNVFNGKSTLTGYGPQTPEYAKQLSVREYGVQLSAGVKGSF